MKLLVIGGSYFYGRVFVMTAAEEHDITVLNRGTYSMEEFGVRQIRGDRHDRAVLAECAEAYDAVIDFCAYEPGDVSGIAEGISGRIGQYILISTVDVYERSMRDCAAWESNYKKEETALEYRKFPGEAGAYIAGKVALEKEIREVCGKKQIPYTLLRPAILYGPYNYAPRESVYIQMLLQNHALPVFTDAEGRFQFVYVKDAAAAIMKCLGNRKAYGQAYNLCQDEILTYDRFFDGLKKAAEPEVLNQLQEIPLKTAEASAQGVPVVFPVTKEETELCDNTKSKEELGMEYTDFEEGMRKTYRAFKGVFQTEPVKTEKPHSTC